MYSIVVTAGPSLDESTHKCVHVNSETYVPISSTDFEGQITVRVKDFQGLAPDGQEPIAQSDYFDVAKDMTFSIEASGEIDQSEVTPWEVWTSNLVARIMNSKGSIRLMKRGLPLMTSFLASCSAGEYAFDVSFSNHPPSQRKLTWLELHLQNHSRSPTIYLPARRESISMVQSYYRVRTRRPFAHGSRPTVHRHVARDMHT